MKSKTLVSSSIQWDFCSFLSRERNADGIYHFWQSSIFVNELSDNFVNELSLDELMISWTFVNICGDWSYKKYQRARLPVAPFIFNELSVNEIQWFEEIKRERIINTIIAHL